MAKVPKLRNWDKNSNKKKTLTVIWVYVFYHLFQSMIVIIYAFFINIVVAHEYDSSIIVQPFAFTDKKILQGISYWNGTYELALMDKDMQVKFGLKIVLECWGREFLGTTTIFQKNNISWPQHSPTEKVLNFNMIFHDSTPKKVF